MSVLCRGNQEGGQGLPILQFETQHTLAEVARDTLLPYELRAIPQ